MYQLVLWCLVLVAAQNDNSILTRLQNLETQLDRTEDLLRQFTAGQALFFVDMDHCPPGFHPAEIADGRFILIHGKGRGGATEHTIFTNNGLRSIDARCKTRAEVAESGMIEVCVNTDIGTDLELDLTRLMPHFSMFLCLKDNTGAEPTSPRVT
jgi:hypothetical protein